MNVTMLHTEDCPNLEPLLAELRSLIDGRDEVTLTATPVRSDDDALRLGFYGSPTILSDGTTHSPDHRDRSGFPAGATPAVPTLVEVLVDTRPGRGLPLCCSSPRDCPDLTAFRDPSLVMLLRSTSCVEAWIVYERHT